MAIFAMCLLVGHCSGCTARAFVWTLLTAGPQGGHLDASEAGNGERGLGTCSPGGGTFGSRNCGGFDWALSVLGLCPDHMAVALGPLVTGGWQWTRKLEPHPVSFWGDFIPAHSPAGRFCKFLFGGLRWLGEYLVLMEFVLGQGAPVQCP
jgi:hypothetical protein